MNWFKENPKKAKNIPDGLNKKYGNFDFTKSSRFLYKKEFQTCLNKKFNYSGKVIAIVGGNNGHEADYLKGKPQQLFIVDLAQDALRKVSGSNTFPVFASAEKMPLIDNYLDYYLAFRVLFSEHVTLKKSLEEAKRVLKPQGVLIISVSNGYLVGSKIEKGMFNYKKDSLDLDLPYKHLKKCVVLLKELGFKNIQDEELPGEIVISANKS